MLIGLALKITKLRSSPVYLHTQNRYRMELPKPRFRFYCDRTIQILGLFHSSARLGNILIGNIHSSCNHLSGKLSRSSQAGSSSTLRELFFPRHDLSPSINPYRPARRVLAILRCCGRTQQRFFGGPRRLRRSPETVPLDGPPGRVRLERPAFPQWTGHFESGRAAPHIPYKDISIGKTQQTQCAFRLKVLSASPFQVGAISVTVVTEVEMAPPCPTTLLLIHTSDVFFECF